MTITYPLSLPAAPGMKSWRIFPHEMAAEVRSPFTGERQVYRNQGQLWKLSFNLPAMLRAGSAEDWISTFIALKGVYGTFLAGDPLGKTARGTMTGTPLVNGASQTGESLITDGWTAGITIKAGNYIQLGTGSTSRLHKNLQDAVVNGSGQVTLDIWPRLRVSPADNAAITVASCKGIFALDAPFDWGVEELFQYKPAISATEVI